MCFCFDGWPNIYDTTEVLDVCVCLLLYAQKDIRDALFFVTFFPSFSIFPIFPAQWQIYNINANAAYDTGDISQKLKCLPYKLLLFLSFEYEQLKFYVKTFIK